VLGVATACTRSAFWLIGHRVTIPPRVQEMLRYAPACALAAIVGPDLVLGAQGEVAADWRIRNCSAVLPHCCITCGGAACCRPSYSGCLCSRCCAYFMFLAIPPNVK
jgi:branched-subunit amino acid transport protein